MTNFDKQFLCIKIFGKFWYIVYKRDVCKNYIYIYIPIEIGFVWYDFYLDSERSEEFIDFTMMFFFMYCFSRNNFSSTKLKCSDLYI